MTRRTSILGCLAVCFTFAGCGDESGSGGAGGATATTAGSTTSATATATSTTNASTTSGNQGGGGGSGAATVTLMLDTTTVVAGGTVNGTVTVENFILEAPMGQPNQEGHGHFHIYLDDAMGVNYLVAGETTSVPITIPGGTAPGAHTLRISLGQNSHAPVSPPVEDVVDITVQ